MSNIARFRKFVQDMTRLVERHGADEPLMLDEGARLLRELVTHDDWLPEDFARPSPDSYRQYLLHCDPLERFCVVSFVWGPGQKTPIHDHTVWGLVGMMRGAERCRRYERAAGGSMRAVGEERVLAPGEIDAVSPTVGDIHTVANALGDQPSISIHVYGANIGAVRRHVFDAATGAAKDFVSGYSIAMVPNLWDRSAAVRAS
ncbi:MAG TPA: cysteine dioxygenase, partial [Burkholderiales bacterium]|nr:cysteine dioxygenase [Burkholderiales bacterium]